MKDQIDRWTVGIDWIRESRKLSDGGIGALYENMGCRMPCVAAHDRHDFYEAYVSTCAQAIRSFRRARQQWRLYGIDSIHGIPQTFLSLS